MQTPFDRSRTVQPASRRTAGQSETQDPAAGPVFAADLRGSAAAQRRLFDAIADSPVARSQRARIQMVNRPAAAASPGGFGQATVQRLVYFTDADGAGATADKPKTYPMWESPLKGTDQGLYDTALGARTAVLGALNAAALDDLSQGEPTVYSGGGAPANGKYEFWQDAQSTHVLGHALHDQDGTNKLTRITKPGKSEKRTEYKPVEHDHAVDYGPRARPYEVLANPGLKYDKAAGALDHYLQKPQV